MDSVCWVSSSYPTEAIDRAIGSLGGSTKVFEGDRSRLGLVDRHARPGTSLRDMTAAQLGAKWHIWGQICVKIVV
jgi:hypothetical protein